MRFFHSLKTKSKQFLCHTPNKEISSGKIDFLSTKKKQPLTLISPNLLISLDSVLLEKQQQHVYPQVLDIKKRIKFICRVSFCTYFSLYAENTSKDLLDDISIIKKTDR